MSLKVSDAVILDLAERAALASGAKPRNADLSPGVYHVDFTVRVTGTVRKGDDYVATVPAAVNPWAVLGFVLSKVNATTADAVGEAVAEAYRSGTLDTLGDATKRYAEAVMERIADATRTIKSGPTTVTVTVTRV